ncbi:MAG: hypothetical protein ACRCWF_04740 [Beijerinckiaceae bacterium]
MIRSFTVQSLKLKTACLAREETVIVRKEYVKYGENLVLKIPGRSRLRKAGQAFAMVVKN